MDDDDHHDRPDLDCSEEGLLSARRQLRAIEGALKAPEEEAARQTEWVYRIV